MANYFYVKSGGSASGASVDTGNGIYSSLQTGAWSGTASEYFDNLYDACVASTVKPTAGDFIMCSDAHAFSGDCGGVVVIPGTVGAAAPISIISVDNANRENYKPGASENLTDGFDDYNTKGNMAFYGVSFENDDILFNSNQPNSFQYWQDCTLTVDANTDNLFYNNADGGIIVFVNVTVHANTGGDLIYFAGGSRLYWYGGSLTGSATNFYYSASGQNGGQYVILKGVDMSSYSGAITPTLTANVDDNCFFGFEDCKLHASVTLPTSQFTSLNHRMEMFNCDDSTGAARHRFYIADGAGVAKNNDSTYVTADEAWGYDGTSKSSIEVTTTSYCSHATPFRFELPAQWVDLSAAASDKITIELTTDQTLTDTDIAAFLCYPDGTTPVQANWVTSGKTVGAGNYGVDPLAAGTTLTASALGAGDWTGEPVSPNFYVMELDTSGDAGTKTAVSIRIEVYKASIAAGELFISPQISLS